MKNKSTLLFWVTLIFCSAQTANASSYFSLAALKGSLAGWWQGKSRNNDVYAPDITSFPVTVEVHTVKAGKRMSESDFDIYSSTVETVEIENAIKLQELIKDLKISLDGKTFVVKIPSIEIINLNPSYKSPIAFYPSSPIAFDPTYKSPIAFYPSYRPSADKLLSLPFQEEFASTAPIDTPSTTTFKKHLENSRRPTAFTKPVQTTSPHSFPERSPTRQSKSKKCLVEIIIPPKKMSQIPDQHYQDYRQVDEPSYKYDNDPYFGPTPPPLLRRY